MYLFYVDESGERHYGPSSSQYFTLTATAIEARQWKMISMGFDAIKQKYFGTTDVEIKSVWLRNQHQRKKRYINKYQITDAQLNLLADEINNFIDGLEFWLISSVFNKTQMQNQYGVNACDPTEYCFESLVERMEGFLTQIAAHDYGIVIHDRISNIQATKSVESAIRRKQARIQHQGTPYQQVDHVIEDVFFQHSHENNLLQVSDLLGYNIYRQFRDHGQEWDQNQSFTNKYPFFSRYEHHIVVSNGDYAGVGIKKMP